MTALPVAVDAEREQADAGWANAGREWVHVGRERADAGWANAERERIDAERERVDAETERVHVGRERVVPVPWRGHPQGRFIRSGLEARSVVGRTARTRVRPGWPAADRPVAPRPGPETGDARYVVFTVLLGSWIVAVTVAGVLIPPVPLLIFLLFRMAARRRHPA